MKCLCEDCGMNEKNFGIMNYSDEFPCHEPHCCRDCSCFDECMEQEDEEEIDDDELEDSEDEDYCGYFDGE